MNASKTRILAVPAALFLSLAALPAQREAFTLSRLVRLSDKAALFRVERVLSLGKGESAVELTALDPVKGIERFESLRVLRRGDLCFEADLGRLPGGSRILLFTREVKGRPGLFTQLPGGLLPGRPDLADAARAILEAWKKGDLAGVLAAQLLHPEPRVWRDAVLSLYRSRAEDLSARAESIRPALGRLVRRESRDPDAFATWTVRLAERMGMKEVVPDLVEFYIRTDGTAGFSPFLLKAMKRLDPEGAAKRAALAAAAKDRRPALAAARLLAGLGGRDALFSLKSLAASPFPEVRALALRTLAARRPGKGGPGKSGSRRPAFQAIFKGERRYKR